MSTVQRLNEITANLGVLYAKLHQHHFYVKGQDFYKLHELFETQYNEVHEQFDEVAERILMIGGKPVSTLGEFLALNGRRNRCRLRALPHSIGRSYPL